MQNSNNMSERQVHINQRILALRYVFGEKMEHYKFESLDAVFQVNSKFLDVGVGDIEKFNFSMEIIKELKKLEDSNDKNSAIAIIQKADFNQYVQILFEYRIWKENAK